MSLFQVVVKVRNSDGGLTFSVYNLRPNQSLYNNKIETELVFIMFFSFHIIWQTCRKKLKFQGAITLSVCTLAS
jgi:hypothetical protein